MNSTEEAIYVILLQNDDQNNEQLVAYMNQSLSNDEIKYYFIEKQLFLLLRL
jgi:hypothetical protein